jgi:hypothetical protein
MQPSQDELAQNFMKTQKIKIDENILLEIDLRLQSSSEDYQECAPDKAITKEVNNLLKQALRDNLFISRETGGGTSLRMRLAQETRFDWSLSNNDSETECPF